MLPDLSTSQSSRWGRKMFKGGFWQLWWYTFFRVTLVTWETPRMIAGSYFTFGVFQLSNFQFRHSLILWNWKSLSKLPLNVQLEIQCWLVGGWSRTDPSVDPGIPLGTPSPGPSLTLNLRNSDPRQAQSHKYQCPARVDIEISRSESEKNSLSLFVREVKSEMKIWFTHFENEKWKANALNSRSRVKSEMKMPWDRDREWKVKWKCLEIEIEKWNFSRILEKFLRIRNFFLFTHCAFSNVS